MAEESCDPGAESPSGSPEAARPRCADDVLDDAMAAILREKTPAERLAIAFGMWQFARDMLRATLRQDHPDWDETELNRQVARRLSHGAV